MSVFLRLIFFLFFVFIAFDCVRVMNVLAYDYSDSDDVYIPPLMFEENQSVGESVSDLSIKILQTDTKQNSKITVFAPVPVKKPDIVHSHSDNTSDSDIEPENDVAQKELPLISKLISGRSSKQASSERNKQEEDKSPYETQGKNEMPAVPAGEVEKEVLYLPDDDEISDVKADISEEEQYHENDNNDYQIGKSDLSIFFPEGSIYLNEQNRKSIITHIILPFQKNHMRIISVEAFADVKDGSLQNKMNASRTSLKRAMAMRNFLVSRGIRDSQISIKSFESHGKGGDGNRVDIYLK